MSFEGDCNTIKDDDCLSCFKGHTVFKLQFKKYSV